ncbi:hypothetical protein BCV70DRAFT_96207 [Testicularia cyperi]|uniref:Uncharacterized protein n=1 Tax=Testicularia cyperi TaxID=1882483 RepID=A0A317XQD2_9BASI|nr:hypothetical protein BCV70DRAFT_96207 [Testicularia cyperi]
MLWPVGISSVAAVALAISTYLPFRQHYKLHGGHLDPRALSSTEHLLNLEHCKPVSPRLPNQPAGPSEPSFCEDVVLDSRTGMAYLSCDPTRLTWDARAGILEHESPELESELGAPAIWAWDTTQSRLPRRLYISFPPPEYPHQAPVDLRTHFHPLGIAVTAAHPYFIEEVEEGKEPRPAPPANLVLVANHPFKNRPGVVDVFVHDLDKVGRKDHASLRWIRRIEGDELLAQPLDSSSTFQVDPFRIAIFAEQHGDEFARDYPQPAYVAEDPNHLAGFSHDDDEGLATRHVRIPSFFVTSLPPTHATAVLNGSDSEVGSTGQSSVYSSFYELGSAVLSPSNSKEADEVSRKVFLYHASIGKTSAARLDGGEPEQWQGFPPLVQAWDGNGKQGGSNTSAAALFVPSVSSGEAKVQEWEQHWVRGISAGIREHLLPQHTGKAAKLDTSSIEKSKAMRIVKTYTPSFVSFFKAELEAPARALAIDKRGRIWTAANPDTRAVEAWIAAQRRERRRRLGLGQRGSTSSSSLSSLSSSSIPRPASRVDQTTYVYRHMGQAVAHPWELDKLHTMKQRGIWLHKNYHTFGIFKTPDETTAELEARSDQDLKDRGFLPTVPTGLAIDADRGVLLVTGAYEDRGIAICSLPPEYVEK